MSSNVKYGALAGVGLVVAIALSALSRQRVLEDGLPPRIECVNRGEAMIAALHAATERGGSIIPVLGTGSMAPWIPAAAPGLDPWKTVVALVLTRANATFDDVTPGVPCIYQAGPGYVMHGAARLTADGWIMSGLHNERSDVWMTREMFVGIVAQAFVWPQTKEGG